MNWTQVWTSGCCGQCKSIDKVCADGDMFVKALTLPGIALPETVNIQSSMNKVGFDSIESMEFRCHFNSCVWQLHKSLPWQHSIQTTAMYCMPVETRGTKLPLSSSVPSVKPNWCRTRTSQNAYYSCPLLSVSFFGIARDVVHAQIRLSLVATVFDGNGPAVTYTSERGWDGINTVWRRWNLNVSIPVK